jgi:hypothetical protein
MTSESVRVLYSKTSESKQKNVISFSVYGEKNVYLLGAEKNIDIAKDIYPGWICRFYCQNGIKNLEELKRRADLGECEVIVLDSPIFPMYWRYFAADDPNITNLIIRDTDSLVNYREMYAVKEWLTSDKILHTMHDHGGGHWSPIMGGMCGFKLPLHNFEMIKEIDTWCKAKRNYQFHYSDDQSFLSQKLLPLFKHSQIDHHNNPSASKWENSIIFPDHPPIKYGNFVGDRVSAFSLMKDSYRDLESDQLFLMPHLGPGDIFSIKELVTCLLKVYKKIVIPYKVAGKLNIHYLFGGHPSVELKLVESDDDAFNLYTSNYTGFKFIGLGCHSSGDNGYSWGLKHGFLQSGIEFEDVKFIAYPDSALDYSSLPSSYTNLPKVEPINSSNSEKRSSLFSFRRKQVASSSNNTTTSTTAISSNLASADPPLVSVVIPTYNRFSYLLNAIKSVYKQTHQNFEIIVVNDRSTDSEYYNNYKQDFDDRLHVINLPKNSRSLHKRQVCGGGDSRNIGIMMSSGEYISVLDDDDQFLPDKLSKQLSAIQNSGPKVNMCSTEALHGHGPFHENVNYKNWHYQGVFWPSIQRIFSQHENFLNEIYGQQSNIVSLKHISVHNVFCCSSVMFARSLVNSAGYFPIHGMGEDWVYWKKLMNYTDCVYIRDPLTYVDASHGNGQHWK